MCKAQHSDDGQYVGRLWKDRLVHTLTVVADSWSTEANGLTHTMWKRYALSARLWSWTCVYGVASLLDCTLPQCSSVAEGCVIPRGVLVGRTVVLLVIVMLTGRRCLRLSMPLDKLALDSDPRALPALAGLGLAASFLSWP